MKFFKQFAVVFLLLVVLVPGSVALANTSGVTYSSDIQAQINQLLKLIEELKKLQNIAVLPICEEFSRDLTLGSSGPDVTRLQKILVAKGYLGIPAGVDYGYFGSLTKAGVIKWQVSQGIYPANGYFGANSRKVINGCSVENGQGPVISSISGPTTLKKGEVGTWTTKASSPSGGQLTYSVNWDHYDTAAGTTASLSSPTTQTSTFTHAYDFVSGDYKIFNPKFTVRDAQGRESISSISVKVYSGSVSEMKVTSPGNETWTAGAVKQIKWSGFNSDKVTLKLRKTLCGADGRYSGSCRALSNPETFLLDNISNTGVYNWIVATDVNDNQIPVGNYQVIICTVGFSPVEECRGSHEFTIKSNQTNTRILSPISGDSWSAGSVEQIKWQGLDSRNVSIKLVIGNYCTELYSGPCAAVWEEGPDILLEDSVSNTGSYNWIVGTDVNDDSIRADDYKVKICETDSSTCIVSGAFNFTRDIAH